MAGRMIRGLGAAALAMAAGACASGSAPSNSGFLTTYEGLTPRTDVVRASVQQRRDEALASTITRLWVAPTEVFGVTDPILSDDDRRAVLSEVDRQVCYELSERFEIAEQPERC